MICVACTNGGDYNKQANRADSDVMRLHYQKLAEDSHIGCPGRELCNCQHVIGVVVK